MEQNPAVFTASVIQAYTAYERHGHSDLPARPVSWQYGLFNPRRYWDRLIIASKVFTGRYDALDWGR